MASNDELREIERREQKIRELEQWIADLQFLLSEVMRINSSMPGNIPGYDRLK